MTRSIAVTMHHHSWLSLISRNRSSSLGGCLLRYDISSQATTDQSSDHLCLWPPYCPCHLSLPPAPPRPPHQQPVLPSASAMCPPACCQPRPAASSSEVAFLRPPAAGSSAVSARQSAGSVRHTVPASGAPFQVQPGWQRGSDGARAFSDTVPSASGPSHRVSL